MSITVAEVQNQLWQEGNDAATSALITDWIVKADKQAKQYESRLTGDTLDLVVLDLTLAIAYTFLRLPDMAKIKTDSAMSLIENARAGYNSTGSMTDTVDSYPTKTIGRISNDLLRDLPGSYDTHNRTPR